MPQAHIKTNRPLTLVILDGWGYATKRLGNAILSAPTPTMDMLMTNFPTTMLQASGSAVGLSWGEPGNSEVGHLTLGAGRNIFQYSSKINLAIEDGSFFENPALIAAIDHVQTNNSTLHLAGLFGSGTAHSNFQHLIALIDLAHRKKVPQVAIHLFTDGKDSGLKESPLLLKKLFDHLTDKPGFTVVSVVGRHYAMDRDNNWHRTESAYNLLVNGHGYKTTDCTETIAGRYRQGFTDTDMPPITVLPTVTVQDNDALIFFDFREDSMRQIGHAFADTEFQHFYRVIRKNLCVVFMTQYFQTSNPLVHIAFPLPTIDNGLAETISLNGLKQLHITETEKYAHATYFFNCLHSQPFVGETDVLIESQKDHLLHPEMRSEEIVERFIQEFGTGAYAFTIMTLANADILSHTGNLKAAIAGVQFVDRALSKIYQQVMAQNSILAVTADHGNAESLVYTGSGSMETKHNINPVPFIIAAKELERPLTPEEKDRLFTGVHGIISDVAPTILELLGIVKPVEMTGESLLSHLLGELS